MTDFGLSQASEQAWSLDDWLGLMTRVGFQPVTCRLLNELLAGDGTTASAPIPEAVRISDRLTKRYRLGRFLSPRLAWGHDVKGNSPGPGGNFIEDRKALTLGLNFNFQNRWAADISYTDYFGAGRYNLINDRDFIAANFKYSF